MSRFIRHDTCPECGSKNNLAMSPDTIDSLVVAVAAWIEREQRAYTANSVDLDDDKVYDSLSSLIHSELEPFITRDRNYN